jgi:hypothetical protein
VRDVVLLAGATVLALAAVAGAVIGGGDSTVLVSPPEAVAESFVRDLIVRRYELAMEYVDEASGVSLTTVRRGGDLLARQLGPVMANDAQGERSTIAGSTASAVVLVRAPRAVKQMSVRLVRVPGGTWRVAGWTVE